MKECKMTPTVSRRKLLTCLFLGVVSFSMAVLLLVIDPIPIVARIYTRISNDSIVLDFLKNKLDSVHVSVYLFNITNPEEFMSGEDHQLKVQEVGPFTYRETLYIENMIFDEVAGVMRYSPRVEAMFVVEESIGRPEDFNLTMPNLTLLGLASIMSTYPFFVHMAFNVLVRQQKSKAFIKVDAKSFMWGTPDPLLKLANTVVPGLMNSDKLGLLDQLYNAHTKNDLVVGATEKDKFQIKTRNGRNRLTLSPLHDSDTCNKCDTFENSYEGMMYPSPVLPETPIRLFRNGFCKIVDMEFREKTVLENGVEALVFQFNNSFFDKGRLKGLLDISDCNYGFPTFLSKVHFLDADPEIYKRIDGIKQDPDKFRSYIMIEPITGVGIATHGSAQINLALDDLSFNSVTRRFSNIVLPVCYAVFKQPELPELVSSILKILYVTVPISLLVTRIVLFLLSFLLLSLSTRYLRCRTWSKHVTAPHVVIDRHQCDTNNDVKVAECLIPN